MLVVRGTLVPTHDHAIDEQSKNYRYLTRPASIDQLVKPVIEVCEYYDVVP